MRFIPAIDLYQGACVRLFQGNFARNTPYRLRPGELLKRYEEAGADWVHVVDLDGARSGERENQGVIGDLAANCTARLQVGGGVRSACAVELLLKMGVSRVLIGSAAVERVAETRAWISDFGAERVCLAFDVRTGRDEEPRVYIHGWERSGSLSLWQAVDTYADVVRHVLCTDIARDGTLAGPNTALYSECLKRFPDLHWQASGGIGSSADVEVLAATGVRAAVSGRALLDERLNLRELRSFLHAASSPA